MWVKLSPGTSTKRRFTDEELEQVPEFCCALAFNVDGSDSEEVAKKKDQLDRREKAVLANFYEQQSTYMKTDRYRRRRVRADALGISRMMDAWWQKGKRDEYDVRMWFTSLWEYELKIRKRERA